MFTMVILYTTFQSCGMYPRGCEIWNVNANSNIIADIIRYDIGDILLCMHSLPQRSAGFKSEGHSKDDDAVDKKEITEDENNPSWHEENLPHFPGFLLLLAGTWARCVKRQGICP